MFSIFQRGIQRLTTLKESPVSPEKSRVIYRTTGQNVSDENKYNFVDEMIGVADNADKLAANKGKI